MKKILVVITICALCISLFGCGKSEAIKSAEAAIKAIGEVTLESEEAINNAEKAIEALSAEEKEKFKKASELEKIKAEFNHLKEEKKVQEVIKQIDEIGDITLESGKKIDAAQKILKELSSEMQGKVTNKSKLEESVEKLKALRAIEKERIINEKTPLFNLNHDKVEGITWYEHKNQPRYIDIRSYIIPYIGKRGDNVWVCTRYNYTADSWIFWESMTIMVDGEKYTKYVGRSNTTRDNDTEVWEYYDEALNYNLDMDNKDLKMLKAISESKETIIRFQGDEYHYDLYVTQTDKNIIADVLNLYQAFMW